jgi:hypothetical protein
VNPKHSMASHILLNSKRTTGFKDLFVPLCLFTCELTYKIKIGSSHPATIKKWWPLEAESERVNKLCYRTYRDMNTTKILLKYKLTMTYMLLLIFSYVVELILVFGHTMNTFLYIFDSA